MFPECLHFPVQEFVHQGYFNNLGMISPTPHLDWRIGRNVNRPKRRLGAILLHVVIAPFITIITVITHYSIQCCFWCIWTLLYGYYINAKSISIALFDDTFHPMVPRKLHIQVGHGLFFTVFSHFPNFLSLGWSKDIDMILGKLV